MPFEGGDWEGLWWTMWRAQVWLNGSGFYSSGKREHSGVVLPDWGQASMNSGQGHTLSLELSLHYLLPVFKAMLLYNLDIIAKDNFLLEAIIVFYVGEVWLSKSFFSSSERFILLTVECPRRGILANDGFNPLSLRVGSLRLPKTLQENHAL